MGWFVVPRNLDEIKLWLHLIWKDHDSHFLGTILKQIKKNLLAFREFFNDLIFIVLTHTHQAQQNSGG